MLVRCTFLALAVNLAVVDLAYSEPAVPSFKNTEFFYELGGGTGITTAGGVEVPDLLMLDRDFAMLFGIGSFDPLASIRETLNNLEDEARSKLVGIGDTITSSISAIPGYVFCRANPLGCQMHENYTKRAEDKAKTAVQYLENVESQVGASRAKLDGWFQAAKGSKLVDTLARTGGASSTDVEAVADEVREFTGEEGLKWLGGGYAGGDDQPPIRPVADTVKAGFNYQMGRPVTNDAPVTGDDPMLSLWDTPEEAAKWLTEVVGEYRPDINNDSTGRPSSSSFSGADDGDDNKGGEDVNVTAEFTSNDVSTPALGLVSKVRKESLAVQEQLAALADMTEMPTAAQVSQIMGSSTNSVIPRDLFIKLRSSSVQDQALRRLADDIAISNVIRYALEARRLLISGRNEPHIAAYSVAQDEIDQKIRILEKDIDMLMFERRVSKELVSETIRSIYRNAAGTGGAALPASTGSRVLGNGVRK